MDTEIFIEEVRKHKLLYDLSHKDYKNVQMKSNVWEQLGKSFNCSGEACRKRWKGLRDTYKKYKRATQLPSGSGRVPSNKWKYWDTISFLDECADSRPTIGNVVPANCSFDEIIEIVHEDSRDTPPSEVLTASDGNGSCEWVPRTKTSSKRKAEAEVNEVFAKSMMECVEAVKKIASPQTENSSISLAMQLASSRLSKSNLSQDVIDGIETKVLLFVEEQIREHTRSN